MRQRELVRVLLHKAAQDEAVLRSLLPDSTFDTATLGFHAQQAMEKLLKAWLAHLGVDYPHVHRLETLAELLQNHGEALPLTLSDLMRLTPFGTVFRYDDLPLETDVEPETMLGQVEKLRAFVESKIE
jgi:HEPN domain-containing protein